MSDLCRSCKAPVRWVRMAATSRAMPLNAEPSERGNIRILDDGRAMVLAVASEREALRAAAEPLYVSHFATCENAASHRKVRA